MIQTVARTFNGEGGGLPGYPSVWGDLGLSKNRLGRRLGEGGVSF